MVLSALSSTKLSQFFKILIFSKDIWGNVHYVPEINLISYGTLIKAFISRAEQTKRNLRHGFLDEGQLKTIMKINVSPNMPCTFLLFKASAFLQSFFPSNLLSGQVLKTSFFLNSKYLTFLYLFISLLKNIHQKYQIKEHTFLYLLTILFL